MMAAFSHLALAVLQPAVQTPLRRSFLFVPYGSPAPASLGNTISCDGKVEGATLELTHWTDNLTPEELYADSSTECALRLAALREQGRYTECDDATVLNNHFDTDGLLPVWACLELPAVVLPHAKLLADGAAAGDFGEWSSDAGVKLDAALEAIGADAASDAIAYDEALAALPLLLKALSSQPGAEVAQAAEATQHALWEEAWAHVSEGWVQLLEGSASLSRSCNDCLLLVNEPEGGRLAPAAVHRGVCELLPPSPTAPLCTRWLRVQKRQANPTGHEYHYEYELPGHGWVKRLVSRAAVTPPADPSTLVAALAKELGHAGPDWKAGGFAGLTALCHSGWISAEPVAVINALARLDTNACLAALPSSTPMRTTAPQMSLRPRHASRGSVGGLNMKLPPEVATEISDFAALYKANDIEALWKAVRECYGSEEAALQAVRQNNAVLSPVYATPALLRRSALLLKQLLGEEDAAKVLRDNPAVLTCGEVLAESDPAEIKRIAAVRRVLDSIPKSGLQGLVAVLVASIAYRLVVGL